MTQTGTSTTKRTDQLVPGDRVVIGKGRIVRTVKYVRPSGYTNRRNEPILNVIYVESPIPGVWSYGNSSNASGVWAVAK